MKRPYRVGQIGFGGLAHGRYWHADGPALAAQSFSVYWGLLPKDVVVVRDRSGRVRRYVVGRRPNILRTRGVGS